MKIRYLLIGGLILVMIYAFTPEKRQLEVATWLWDTELLKGDLEEIVDFIKEEKVTTIYLQYLQELEFTYYQSFIEQMTEANVVVYALDGSPTWAADRSQEDAFLDWFSSYQSSALPHQQFKGIHLDVEPYLQSDWESNQAAVVEDYQLMVQRVARKSKQLDATFGVDIPFWFDEIDFENQFGRGKLAQWIIETVDEITIMAYRNYAEGEGGIIEISQTEIEWADAAKTRVIIAVETVPLPETYTSFHTMTSQKLEEELQTVKKFFRKNESFSGVAIHHLISWKELKQP